MLSSTATSQPPDASRGTQAMAEGELHRCPPSAHTASAVTATPWLRDLNSQEERQAFHDVGLFHCLNCGGNEGRCFVFRGRAVTAVKALVVGGVLLPKAVEKTERLRVHFGEADLRVSAGVRTPVEVYVQHNKPARRRCCRSLRRVRIRDVPKETNREAVEAQQREGKP
eukprot:GHVT01039559.1.p1 GENE.GHVT01039559.1~~GHVT01039559.1.p1  ORF type:complete len:169 (+),score=19.40 GHVT01039559.1:312-818(+)